MFGHYFLPIEFYSKKWKLNSLRTEAFFLISLIKSSIDSWGFDLSIEKHISKVFKIFTEIFRIINKLVKIEAEYWRDDMFDEEFYLTDLRREILWIIDHILIALDEKSKQLEQANIDIQVIDKPLKTIRIIKLREDMLNMQEKLKEMRIQFN